MKKLIITFCFISIAIALAARPITGIRVECPGEPILVFLNGEQISNATQTCFIANLPDGRYRLEIYSVRHGRPHGHEHKGELIYNQTFHYRATGIKDIFIKTEGNNYQEEEDIVMDDAAFDELIRILNSKAFDHDKQSILKNALFTTQFSAAQSKRIIQTFGFRKLEPMKLLYPATVDKQNFLGIVELLTFSSEKEDMNRFIQNYHKAKE